MTKKQKKISGAMTFIILMGIVSLFSDMTHEGGRSVLGEYFNLAGASAATIGFAYQKFFRSASGNSFLPDLHQLR